MTAAVSLQLRHVGSASGPSPPVPSTEDLSLRNLAAAGASAGSIALNRSQSLRTPSSLLSNSGTTSPAGGAVDSEPWTGAGSPWSSGDTGTGGRTSAELWLQQKRSRE